MNEDSDEDLLRSVGQGDARAMRTLVARKLPRVLGLARRMLADPAEAEDVAQETFVRIWRQASSWRSQGARFDTWIHRVALNLCYDRLRRRGPDPGEPLTEIPDPSPLPDVADEGERDARRVEQALRALPPRQREAIVLVYYQSLSNIDAAALMGVSVDALESLLSRGRRSMRRLLSGDDTE